MTNEAWEDKSSTALASWSEHAMIPYSTASRALRRAVATGLLRGEKYVEPNVELYQRLLWLTRYSERI